jgi:hypothetical protein
VLPGSPIDLEPDAPEPARRARPWRRIVAGGVVLAVVAVVAALAVGGGGTSGEATVQDLLARATERTLALDEVRVEIHQKVPRFEVWMTAQHRDGITLLETDGLDLDLGDMISTPDLQLTEQDGVWREFPVYASNGSGTVEQLEEAMSAIAPGGAVEVASDGGTRTFRTRCVSGGGFFGELCADDPDALIDVTLDTTTGIVRSMRYEGSIPVYGGEWENGFIEITIAAGPVAELVMPTEYDRSGVECLASELGLEESTSAAVTAAIQGMTTRELNDLYAVACDYQVHPPGADFG